jgi:hypothetical protein
MQKHKVAWHELLRSIWHTLCAAPYAHVRCIKWGPFPPSIHIATTLAKLYVFCFHMVCAVNNGSILDRSLPPNQEGSLFCLSCWDLPNHTASCHALGAVGNSPRWLGVYWLGFIVSWPWVYQGNGFTLWYTGSMVKAWKCFCSYMTTLYIISSPQLSSSPGILV